MKAHANFTDEKEGMKFEGSKEGLWLQALWFAFYYRFSFSPHPQSLSDQPENKNVVFLKVDVDDAQVSHLLSFFFPQMNAHKKKIRLT